MSAADRDYWREAEPSFNRRPSTWSATVWIMVILGACFILQCVEDAYGGRSGSIQNRLALTADAIGRGYIWQFFTFQLLHGSFLHAAFNLLGLWWFGRPVERILGTRRFVAAFLMAGTVGGLLNGTLLWLFPRVFGGSVVGASAGIEGLFAIFCLLHPDVVVNLFFVLPLRARHLLYAMFAFELFFTVVPSGRGGSAAHPAHLGGLILGALWIRWGWHHDWMLIPGTVLTERLKEIFYRRRKSPPLKVLKGNGKPAAVQSTPASPAVESQPVANLSADFIAREVDPILDKIAAHGMSSLTERERQVLAAARDKMAKR